MIQKEWKILRNRERYGDLGSELPDSIRVFCTLGQALTLAERLANYYAGCDFLFFVDDTEDDR